MGHLKCPNLHFLNSIIITHQEPLQSSIEKIHIHSVFWYLWFVDGSCLADLLGYCSTWRRLIVNGRTNLKSRFTALLTILQIKNSVEWQRNRCLWKREYLSSTFLCPIDAIQVVGDHRGGIAQSSELQHWVISSSWELLWMVILNGC